MLRQAKIVVTAKRDHLLAIARRFPSVSSPGLRQLTTKRCRLKLCQLAARHLLNA
jgi:hypothetical protein